MEDDFGAKIKFANESLIYPKSFCVSFFFCIFATR